ncbi:MAG TPA: hypothetical protein VFJ90_13540, partial [Candidatus Didemnitutus sp.]|nr:hypothetical protein [Candidatus Didemnitutus sp.]
MKTPLSRLIGLLAIWAAGAVALVVTPALAWLPVPPALNIPLVALALTVGFGVSVLNLGWLHAAFAELGVRRLVAAHGFRFVGAVFLGLYAQGRLPAEFAHRAGWGDILTAAGALALVFVPEGPWFRRALWGWNLFGTADLIVAVGTAAWLNVTRPGSMAPMAGLPLSLIPLFAVPVFLGTHVWLFRWLAGQK